MKKEIKLPEVSENIESGDVISVLVKVGDMIKIDQPLIELETDKAMFEVPSTAEGKITEIKVKAGDNIKIGATIVVIDTQGTKDDSPGEKKVTKKTETKEGEIDEVRKEETREEEAEEEIQEKDEEPDEKPKVAKELTTDSPKSSNERNEYKKPAPASPSVRRIARELGVDVYNVTGSGKAGRISEDDVKKYVKDVMTSGASVPAGGRLSLQPLPDFSKWGDIKVEKMSKIRKVTAANMRYAWSSVPMVTQFDKADITDLEAFRKKMAPKVEKKGGQLTVTSMLLKVCALALQEFPQFNCSIDVNKSEIIYKKYFNIGVAVDTENGLLVPVVKDIETKNLTQLSIELNQLAEKTRSRKITPSEMEGGNFTISNLGGIGGTAFTPIVYAPQVAILGVSRASMEAKYIDRDFRPRFMLPLALTYDHRIIDGADAARFLRWICDALEQPMLMQI